MDSVIGGTAQQLINATPLAVVTGQSTSALDENVPVCELFLHVQHTIYHHIYLHRDAGAVPESIEKHFQHLLRIPDFSVPHTYPSS